MFTQRSLRPPGEAAAGPCPQRPSGAALDRPAGLYDGVTGVGRPLDALLQVFFRLDLDETTLGNLPSHYAQVANHEVVVRQRKNGTEVRIEEVPEIPPSRSPRIQELEHACAVRTVRRFGGIEGLDAPSPVHGTDHVEDAGADAVGVDDSSTVRVGGEDAVDPSGCDGRVVPVLVLELEDDLIGLVCQHRFVITLPRHVYAKVSQYLVRRTVVLPVLPTLYSLVDPLEGDDRSYLPNL